MFSLSVAQAGKPVKSCRTVGWLTTGSEVQHRAGRTWVRQFSVTFNINLALSHHVKIDFFFLKKYSFKELLYHYLNWKLNLCLQS